MRLFVSNGVLYIGDACIMIKLIIVTTHVVVHVWTREADRLLIMECIVALLASRSPWLVI
jgi:hypothetical protein